MTTFDEKKELLKAKLALYPTPYEGLIALGRKVPELEQALCSSATRVQGCQSVTHLHIILENGHLKLFARSDALISKGLVSLIIELYGGLTPKEALAISPSWIEEFSLGSTLSPSRYQGLKGMILHLYHKTLELSRA